VKKQRDGTIRRVTETAKNMLGDAGVFRGNKGTLREGGLRIPFIIRWPGQVQAGVVDSENVIAGVDWLPSICRLAGVTNVPSDLDGEDVSDIWRGATHPRQKPLLWNSIGHPGPGIRDGKWKYYLLMNRENRIAEEELYDILSDPGEANNLAKKYPEVSSRLREQVLDWKAELPTTVLSTGKYKHQYD
jgi:N-acetylgalactosamine-6-sulfatase